MKIVSKVAPMMGAAVIWFAVSLVPLVPVEYSPVVQDPILKSTFVSIVGSFISPFLCGVNYRATWATFPVMLGMSAAAIFAGWKLGRRIAGHS